MSIACILFLPPDMTAPPRWWRLSGDVVAETGEGWPLLGPDEPLVAVPPIAAVTLHWGELPDRSPAQTLAAARVLADEAIATGSGTHVAIAVHDEAEGLRPIAVAAPEMMRGWIARLASDGLGDAPLIPAALLLPAPDEGFVRAEVPFGAVVRGRGTGFADEPGLTELVTADAVVITLTVEALGTALAAMVAAPSLDLRQGAFARVRRRAMDWALVRRLAILVGMVLLATLAIDLVRLARYSSGAAAMEARANAAARAGLPRGAGTDDDAARLLTSRLARLRGPGLGFTRAVASAYAVVRQVNGAHLTALVFQPSGALRLTVTVPSQAGADALRSGLAAAGFQVEASTFQAGGGRLTGDLTIAAPGMSR